MRIRILGLLLAASLLLVGCSNTDDPTTSAASAGTTSECPDTRAEVLKTIGVESFRQL